MAKDDVVAIEYSSNGDDYNTWTMERVKKAFNLGNGTIEDLKRYLTGADYKIKNK